MAAVSCCCSCSGSPLLITLCHYTHDHELLLYKLVALQCTGLTYGGSIYPHIDALQVSNGIKYVTAEDSCCGSPRVTVETYGPTTNSRNSPSSVVSSTSTLDCTSIRKVPMRSISGKTAGLVGSCTDQSSTTSSNIRDVHNTVVGIGHIVQS